MLNLQQAKSDAGAATRALLLTQSRVTRCAEEVNAAKVRVLAAREALRQAYAAIHCASGQGAKGAV
jgi:hypothetical protein